MKTLKDYLENMFLNLPDTPEVRKAKSELYQMMEDKYTELKNEGKAENEAIGIVISEFGNLEELAENLGIKTYVEEEVVPSEILSLDEAKRFLKDVVTRSRLIAIGVMLCILSPVPVICIDAFSDTWSDSPDIALLAQMDALFMFLLVAIAVALFIFSGNMTHKWSKIKNHAVGIDFQTTDYVKKQYENLNINHTLHLSIGCMLCILCVVPAIFFSVVFPTGFWYQCSGAFMFIAIAVGVYLIVFTSVRNKGYQSLLALNAKGTMGNANVPEGAREVEYNSQMAADIMDVYWQTVTCIYLSISFLTFDWYMTWIIWPVAGCVHAVIKANFQKR